MASRVDYILNLNGDQARKVLLDLHRQGNNLFSKKGYELKLDAKGFNRSLDQATDRVLAFSAATQVLSSVGSAMRRLASDAITVETAISKIQSILNATQSDLKGFTSSIFDLANKTGVSFADAASAAEEFSRQGLSLEKTLKATEAALGLARVSGGNLAKTVQDLVAITSAFGNEALVYSDVADQLGALDAAFSTTTTGLAEGLARVASIANDVGVSFKEMSALIASTKQVTGRTEAVIGNAFKSIFTNIGTESVQNELRAIGVETKNLDGTFVDAEKVIQRLAAAYKNLTDAEQANITFKVAGKYNKNILQGAIFAEQEGVTQKALDVAGDAAGSIAERLKILNDTTETSIQRLQNAITELGSPQIGGIFSTLIKDFSGFATGAAETLKNTFEKGNPIGEALSAGIVSVLKGPVLVLGSVLVAKLIKKITIDLVRAGKSVFDTNKGFSSQKDILRSISGELQKQNVLLTKNKALANGGVSGSTGRPTGTTRTGNPFESNPSLMATPYSTRLPSDYFQRKIEERKALALQKYTESPAQKVGLFSRNIGKNERFSAYTSGVAMNSPEVNSRISNARQARAEKLRNAGFGVGFAAPLIGSAIGSQVGGSGGRVAESVGNGVGLAALGGVFGPLGLAAGAVVGAFGILKTVTEEVYGNFEEINQKVIDSVNNYQQQKDAGDAFVLAQRQFTEALKEGDSALIEKSRKDLEAASAGLSGSFRELLSTAPSDLQSLNEKLKSAAESIQSAGLATVEANKLIAESYKGTFDKLGLFLNGPSAAVTRESSAGIVSQFAKSVDIESLNDSIKSLLSQFNQDGETGKIQNFVDKVIGKAPKELQNSFSEISEKFEGGKEALSLFIFEALNSKRVLQDLSRVQQKATESAFSLQDSFKKVISRTFSKSDLRSKSAFSAEKSRIKIAEIEDTNGSGGFQREIDSLVLSFQESQKDILSSFKEKVAEKVSKSAQGQGQIAKVAKFIEDLDGGKIDLSKSESFSKSLDGLGFLNQGAKKELIDEFGSLSEAAQKLRSSFADSEKTIRDEAGARERVRQKNFNLKRFGDFGADQSGDLKSLISGKSAIRIAEKNRLDKSIKDSQPFSLTSRLNQQNKLAPIKLTEAQADSILKAIEAEQTLGRESSFSKGIEVLANKTKAQAVAGRQASGIVGSQISDIFGSQKNKLPSSISQDGKTQSEIQKALLEGQFEKAKKLVGNLNVSQTGKESILSSIKSEETNFGKAGETAALRTDARRTADNTEQIAINTGILANNQLTAQIAPPKIADIKSSSSLLGSQAVVAANDIDIEKKTNQLADIQKRILEVDKNNIDFKTGVSRSTGVNGGASSLSKEISGNQSFFDFLKQVALEAVTGTIGTYDFAPEGQAGANLSESDRKILEESKTKAPGNERSQFLLQKLGNERFQQLREGALGKAIPDFENKNFDRNSLESQAAKLQDEIKAKEVEKNKAIEEQKRLENAAKSMETTASIFKTATDAFSQGSNQTLTASINVGVTGGDFVSSREAQSQIESVFKSLFIKYTKETTGKEPVLAPTATA